MRSAAEVLSTGKGEALEHYASSSYWDEHYNTLHSDRVFESYDVNYITEQATLTDGDLADR